MAAILLSPAVSDAAIIAGAPTVGDLTLANLQDMRPRKAARFASLAGMYIVLDMGSAVAVNYGLLAYTTASSTATIRWRAATSEANLTAAPGYDSGAVTLWPTPGLETWERRHAHLNLLDNPQTYRFWRVDIADPDNVETNGFEAGRLVLGGAYVAPNGITLQSLIPVPQGEVRVMSQGGEMFAIVRPIRLVAAFIIKFISRAPALGAIFDLARLRGTARDIIVVLETDDPTTLQQLTICGLMDEPIPFTDDEIPYYDILIKVTEL